MSTSNNNKNNFIFIFTILLLIIVLLCVGIILLNPFSSNKTHNNIITEMPKNETNINNNSDNNTISGTEIVSPLQEPIVTDKLMDEDNITPIEEATPIEETTPTDEISPTEEISPTVSPTPLADYTVLNNHTEAWCFQRNSDHTPSGTYEPFDISQYNAYYLDKKAAQAGEKVIYLAFDCGYEYGYTKLILDTLRKHNAPATFFVTKTFLDTDADLVKVMKDDNHIVGNHTINHYSLPECSIETFNEEVDGLERLFKEKTGYDLDKFIRPPKGEYSERVLKMLQDKGYTTIFWSLAYMDYDVDNQPGKEYVVNHFKDYYHNGMITLTHTISESNASALDDVLTFLENEGYRFGRLDELN